MKKFQFPLDTVLDYRRQMQDALQVELSALMAESRRQEAALDAARRQYARINAEYGEKQAGGMQIAEIRGYETGLEVQSAVVAREADRLQKIHQQVESKRRELVQAKQDASSVEKLREKKLKGYLLAAEKSEEQFLDDLVGARSARTSDGLL